MMIGFSTSLQNGLKPIKKPMIVPETAAMINEINSVIKVIQMSDSQFKLFSLSDKKLCHGEAIAGSPNNK